MTSDTTVLAPRDGSAPSTVMMRALAVALLTVHAVLGWLMRTPGLGTGNDDAWYISLARALRQGSYVELPIVGTPAHAMYPPLYPALLATLGVTSPERIDIAALAGVALSVAALALTALVAARKSPWLALAVLLVGAVNPMLLYTASGVHSEPLLAATAAAAIAISVWHRRDARTMALVGLFAIAAALSRSIGLSLVLASLLLFALERRWRGVAALALASGLTVGAWLFWTVNAPRRDAGRSYVADALYIPAPPQRPSGGGESAIDSARPSPTPGATPAEAPTAGPTPPRPLADSPAMQFARTMGRRVTHNIPAYLTRELPTALAVPTVAGTRADNIAWLLVLLVAGIAGIGVLARRATLLVLYLTLSVAVLVAWPYVVQRFLAPLVPMLVLVILGGAWWLGERLAGVRGAMLSCGALAFTMTAGAIRDDAARLGRIARCDRGAATTSATCFADEQRDFFAAVAAATRLSDDSTHFLVSKEATFYLLSGRQAVREADALALPDPRALRDFLERQRVDFIILSRLHVDQWALASPLGAQCRELELVESFGAHVALLRVPRAAAPAESAKGAPALGAPAFGAPAFGARALGAPAVEQDREERHDACAAIARWNAGEWDEPSTLIW